MDLLYNGLVNHKDESEDKYKTCFIVTSKGNVSFQTSLGRNALYVPFKVWTVGNGDPSKTFLFLYSLELESQLGHHHMGF